MKTHNCIKCNVSYPSNEEDAYYCPKCEKEKKVIAAKVDAQMANRPKKQPKSSIQAYDEAVKRAGGAFPHWSSF